MGNKVISPFPSYEVACHHLNELELKHVKSQFKSFCRTGPNLTNAEFCQIPNSCSPYLRKWFLPRLFAVIDSKKDNVIDIEEFISAIALFRIGSLEEKIRVLFLMYEPGKGGVLTRESIRNLLIESSFAVQRSDLINLQSIEERVELQRELVSGMVEAAICQFGCAEGKLDFSEFVSFVKVEGGIQALLQFIPQYVDA